MRKFVVAATSRSGTLYTSRLLTDLGYRCGHEDVFAVHPWGFHGWNGLDGDASWLSVPYLHALATDVVVFHQVREPLSTIRSIATEGMFMPFSPGRHLVMPTIRLTRKKWPGDRYRRFIRAHGSRAWSEQDEFARAARHWVDWNLRIEQAARLGNHEYHRFRVEGIDPAALSSVIGGRTVKPFAEAAAGVSKQTNARRSRYSDTPLDVLSRPLLEEVVALSHRYGYSLTGLGVGAVS